MKNYVSIIASILLLLVIASMSSCGEARSGQKKYTPVTVTKEVEKPAKVDVITRYRAISIESNEPVMIQVATAEDVYMPNDTVWVHNETKTIVHLGINDRDLSSTQNFTKYRIHKLFIPRR